jgi:DNA-binding CsgD family transcriptional regulator
MQTAVRRVNALPGWTYHAVVVGDVMSERDFGLYTLRRQAERAVAGRGGLVWIEGEPGIGKSTVLRSVFAATPWPGLTIHGPVPASALIAYLETSLPRSIDDRLGDAVREDRVDAAARDHHVAAAASSVRLDAAAITDQLYALVREESARGPVAVVVDDLHAADEVSLAVWRRLAAITSDAPLLLVSAGRRIPARAAVDRLRRVVVERPDAVVLSLNALDPVAVEAIAASRLSAAPGVRLLSALATAAGNPRYVGVMIDALTRDGTVRVVDGVAEIDGERADRSMASEVGRHLDFLAAGTRVILGTAAALGDPFAVWHLAVACDRTVPQIADEVVDAVRAGLLVDTEGMLAFRHPLVRDVLAGEMPAVGRAHVARALAAAGAPWSMVGRQVLAQPGALDAWVVPWLVELPPAALHASPDVAVELLGRVYRTLVQSPVRDVVAARLTTALRQLRRRDELRAVGIEALNTLTDPAHVGEVAWNLLRDLDSADRSDLEAAIAGAMARCDADARWRGRLRAARAGRLPGDQGRAEAMRAISDGEQCGDALSIGWALVAMAAAERDPNSALALLERGVTIVTGDDPESLNLRVRLLTDRLAILAPQCRTTEFEAVLANAETLVDRAHDITRRVELHLLAAGHFYDTGDWDRALHHLDSCEDDDVRHRERRHGIAALIAVRRDDLTAAERNLGSRAAISVADHSLRDHRSADRWAIESAAVAESRLVEAAALMTERSGDLAAAAALLRAGLDARPNRSTVLLELVRLALATGDRVAAQHSATALRVDAAPGTPIGGAGNGDAVRNARPDHAAYADVAAAMLDDDPSRLDAAAAVLGGLGLRPSAAFAWREAAVRFAEHGDMPAARAAFTRAVRTYTAIGALPDLRQLEARMQPHGMRRGPHTAYERPASGWPALTRTEIDIAHRLALGHSNADIAAQLSVSPRTVESHVAHLLVKLGVRNRTEIALEVTHHEQSS